MRRIRAAVVWSRIVVGAAVACGFVAAAGGVPRSAEAKVPSIDKVAVVDLQRVLQETKQGKAARRRMERSAKSKQAKLDKMRAKLEADAKKAEALEGRERAGAEQQLQRRFAELQQMAMTLQQDLAAQEGKILEEMYRKIQKVVAGLARKHGIDLVLVRDPGNVIFTKGAYDITDAVISAYDRAHPK